MVRISREEFDRKITSSQPNRRMPRLCAVNKSLGLPILSEGREEATKGLRTNCFNVNEDEKYLTSMAVSGDLDLIVMGSGSPSGNLYFVKDLAGHPDASTKVYPRFDLLQTEQLGAPIHSLDWQGGHLLVGLNQGRVRLYSVRYLDTPDGDKPLHFTVVANFKQNYDLQLPITDCVNSHVKSVQFHANYSVELVQKSWQPVSMMFEPPSADLSTQFLSTVTNQLYIWDVLKETEPVRRWQAQGQPLINCARWSPHAPQTLIVTGGNDRSLSIMDCRSGDVVWYTENAHWRPVRDAQFSTFIPFWLASTGEDCFVNIWDIRFMHHAPVAKIDGHDGVINKLAWSNMRPENMGTASSDGTMRMWMLKADCLPVWDSWHRTARYSKQDTRPVEDPARRFKDIWVYENAVGTLPTPFRNQEAPETPLLVGANGIGEWGRTESGPVFVNEDVDKSKGIVVDIRMSKLYPSLYYCCTSHGQLAAQTVRLDIQDNLQCYHKYNRAEDPIAFQLENYIYCRRLEDAKEDLEQLKAIPKEDIDDPEHMEKMIDHFQDCIKIRPAISPDDWQINSLPDKKNRRKSRRLWTNEDLADLAVSQFKQDLDYWSARIPPGYETRYHFPSDMGITMPREEETDTSARRHNIQITVDNEPVSEDQRHELEQEMEQEMLLTAQLTRTLSSATSTTRSPSTHSVHSLHHQAQDLLKKIPLARVFSRRQPKDQQEPNDTQGREEPLMPELQRNASTRRNALL